jgi:hypothetical protein
VSDESERGSGRGLLSQKDYADARGWSKQYVNQLIKKGRIHLVDGQIDPEQADRALGRTRDPSRVAAFRSDGMGESGNAATGPELDAARIHGSFAKARTVREHYRALKERLEYEQAAGNLISKAEVEDEHFTLARMTRDRVLQGMHDIAGTLAVQFKIDEATVRGQLIERVTGLLNSVADEIERLDDNDKREGEIDAGPAQ